MPRLPRVLVHFDVPGLLRGLPHGAPRVGVVDDALGGVRAAAIQVGCNVPWARVLARHCSAAVKCDRVMGAALRSTAAHHVPLVVDSATIVRAEGRHPRGPVRGHAVCCQRPSPGEHGLRSDRGEQGLVEYLLFG